MNPENGNLGLCKLCGTRPAGAKSHVIPKGLVRLIDPGLKGEVRMIPTDPEEPEGLRRTGPWDPTIFCKECEADGQRYDDHAARLLRATPIPSPFWGSTLVRELPGCDAATLKLFFMHLVWRASESELPDFSGFSIGPSIVRLRDLLVRHDVGTEKDFSVVLFQHPPDPDGYYLISSPIPGVWENGASFARMLIQRWLVMVTTSPLGVPTRYGAYALASGAPTPVVMLAEGWRETWAGEAAIETVRKRMERDEESGSNTD